MQYNIVYRGDVQDIILESFTSREAADRFLRIMKFWFSRPFQIPEITIKRN